METWKRNILDIETFVEDILPKNVLFVIEIEEEENPFGGNPDRKVVINITDNNHLEKITKTFRWQMQAQTETSFLNEIKAYTFDYLVRR